LSNDNKGHSPFGAWLTYKFRAVERILPGLRGKPKHAWVAPFFICLLLLITAISMGIYIDGYGIHPPKQYTGICPAPAQIRGANCDLITIETVTQGTSTVVKTITQSAGQVLTNSSKGGG
jgi:hypothetical protein